MFGGLIINKEAVFEALAAYKRIYQKNRKAVKNRLNINIKGEDKGPRIQKMLDKFEFHAVQIFNPYKENRRNGKLLQENPWKYYPAAERFKLVHDVFISIAPYITKVVMFKAEKQSFLNYCETKGLTATDKMLTENMIHFIISEYQEWLHEEGQHGTIITDRLDPAIRDEFVAKIHASKYKNFWTEPVTVESHLNAFTQIIDIITYCYYMVFTNATGKENFKGIKNVYDKHIKGILEEKDLVDFLNQHALNIEKEE